MAWCAHAHSSQPVTRHHAAPGAMRTASQCEHTQLGTCCLRCWHGGAVLKACLAQQAGGSAQLQRSPAPSCSSSEVPSPSQGSPGRWAAAHQGLPDGQLHCWGTLRPALMRAWRLTLLLGLQDAVVRPPEAGTGQPRSAQQGASLLRAHWRARRSAGQRGRSSTGQGPRCHLHRMQAAAGGQHAFQRTRPRLRCSAGGSCGQAQRAPAAPP